ncbi:MAG: methyl-accepting chemotaxis protein [Longimicrobiaceae bacterium]
MQKTVSRRIASGFAVALGLMLVVTAVAAFALYQATGAYRAALKQQRTNEIPALETRLAYADANLNFVRYLLAPADNWTRRRETAVTEVMAQLDTLRRTSHSDEARALWRDAMASMSDWNDASRDAMEAARSGNMADAHRIRESRTFPTGTAFIRAVDDGLQAERRETDETVKAAEKAARRTMWGLAGAALLALVVGVASAIRLYRDVSDPLRESTGVLASSASEILAATRQQAAGASQSMAAVAETAATVDQVAQTAEQAAQRARMVAESAQRTAEIGKTGRRAVEESQASMAGVREQVESIATSILALAEQAQAIGEIIATVDDIAGQTNLLALNAAIEASRAGEYGRGFAVVAQEIRSLAEQSRGATVQVRQLLGEIQRATSTAVMTTEEGTKQAAVGARQVAEAGDTIRLLAETASDAAQAAAQIVASAGQQASGMGQIRQAMRDIQTATQQNLSATQQTERAAQDLSRIGLSLMELVGTDRRAGPRPG